MDRMSAYQGFAAQAASSSAMQSMDPADPADNIDQEQMTILIVEDLPGLRNHVSALLHKACPGKLKILQASNGQEAVELARDAKPDLVIMDIAMPVLNGMKAAQQIWTTRRNTRILFWSQYHREIYIRELARIVPDEAIHGYVLKTGSDDNFVYAVQSVLLHDNPFFDPVVRSVRARVSQKNSWLSDIELETLNDLMLGLTDRAIAIRRQISLRGVQSRTGALYTKLLKGEDDRLRKITGGTEIVNQRARLIFEAVKRGLIIPEDLDPLNADFYNWIDETF